MIRPAVRFSTLDRKKLSLLPNLQENTRWEHRSRIKTAAERLIMWLYLTPHLSAKYPNAKLPTRKPTLRMDWYMSTNQASEHTRLNWEQQEKSLQAVSFYDFSPCFTLEMRSQIVKMCLKWTMLKKKISPLWLMTSCLHSHTPSHPNGHKQGAVLK